LKYHVFVDFDGTVTTDDVGYSFFKVFARGKAEEVVKKYRHGQITAVECLKGECDIYNEYPAPMLEVKRFIGRQQLTPGFTEFVSFCRRRDYRLTIISAGFDFYIDPILGKNGLADIEVLSNKTIIKNGRIYPEFVYYDEKSCRRCSNCKGLRIKEMTEPGEISIFIGDGHSDDHGAEAADIVFAKKFLAQYLENIQKDYLPFETFHDVIDKLATFLPGQ